MATNCNKTKSKKAHTYRMLNPSDYVLLKTLSDEIHLWSDVSYENKLTMIYLLCFSYAMWNLCDVDSQIFYTNEARFLMIHVMTI